MSDFQSHVTYIEQTQTLARDSGTFTGGFSVGDGAVAATLTQGRTQATVKEVDKVALTN